MSETVASPTRSEAQVEASKRNGALSQGPVTDAGKARSAQNAVRHGVCAANAAALAADREAFVAIMADLEHRLRPATPVEAHWMHEIGHVLWRQRRLAAVESAALEAALDGSPPVGRQLPSLNTLMRYRTRLRRELEDAYAEMAAAQRTRRARQQQADEAAARRNPAPRTGEAAVKPSFGGMNEPERTLDPRPGRSANGPVATPRPEPRPRPAQFGTNEPGPIAT